MSVESSTLSDYPSLQAQQVCERLRISQATLFRWLRRGQAPPSYLVGARRLWREQDLLAWLESRCRQTSHAPGGRVGMKRPTAAGGAR